MFFVLFLFCVYVCEASDFNTKNGLILNIRREGRVRGWDSASFFFKNAFFGVVGTHNLRKATKMSYKATKKRRTQRIQ